MIRAPWSTMSSPRFSTIQVLLAKAPPRVRRPFESVVLVLVACLVMAVLSGPGVFRAIGKVGNSPIALLGAAKGHDPSYGPAAARRPSGPHPPQFVEGTSPLFVIPDGEFTGRPS